MMHSRMTCPAKRLEVVQRIVARASISAAPRTAAVQMMHGEVIAGSTSLTFEAVAFQRFLSVAAKVEVIQRLAMICVAFFFRRACHANARHFRSSFRGAFGAARLRAAVVDVASLTVGALIDRSNKSSVGAAPISGQTFRVVPGANGGSARGAHLLTLARRFVGGATFAADAISKAGLCFAMRCQSARDAPLHVGRLFYDLPATAGTDDGSVTSCCHGPSYAGGWRIV